MLATVSSKNRWYSIAICKAFYSDRWPVGGVVLVFFFFFSLFICTMSSIMHLASPCRNALTFSVYYEKGKAKKKKKTNQFFFFFKSWCCDWKIIVNWEL